MSTRALVTFGMLAGGLALMVVTYFFLSAPWGFPPNTVAHSEPRVPFAPALFVVGIVITFLSAVAYELWPEDDYSAG